MSFNESQITRNPLITSSTLNLQLTHTAHSPFSNYKLTQKNTNALKNCLNGTGAYYDALLRSVGYSDLFCLSKNDLWEVLKDYPTARVRLEAIAVKRMEKYKKKLFREEKDGRGWCVF